MFNECSYYCNHTLSYNLQVSKSLKALYLHQLYCILYAIVITNRTYFISLILIYCIMSQLRLYSSSLIIVIRRLAPPMLAARASYTHTYIRYVYTHIYLATACCARACAYAQLATRTHVHNRLQLARNIYLQAIRKPEWVHTHIHYVQLRPQASRQSHSHFW